MYFKFQTKISLSYISHLSSRIHIIPHEKAKKRKKKKVITKPVKVRDLKISDPGWNSCATFPSWTIPEVRERQRVIFLWVTSEWKTCDEKEVWDLSRPTMSLAPMAKPFKRPILQEQFIKGFIKLGD